MRTLSLLALLAGSLLIPQGRAQEPAAAVDAYEPGPEHPFGRPNPAAPPEVGQFDFMVGEFDCVDRSLQRDGSWNEMKTVWSARYFLNGYGVSDANWKGDFTAVNLRIYDPKEGVWRVSWFRSPPYSESTGWVGRQEGEGDARRMVMTKRTPLPPGGEADDRLTFYDITASSYEWKMERFIGGELFAGQPIWRISCRRVAKAG